MKITYIHNSVVGIPENEGDLRALLARQILENVATPPKRRYRKSNIPMRHYSMEEKMEIYKSLEPLKAGKRTAKILELASKLGVSRNGITFQYYNMKRELKKRGFTSESIN